MKLKPFTIVLALVMLALLCRDIEPLIQARAQTSGRIAALFLMTIRNAVLAAGVWLPFHYFDAENDPRQTALVFSFCTVQNAVVNELVPIRLIASLTLLATVTSLLWTPTKAPINPD
jgi:hypothetical protein